MSKQRKWKIGTQRHNKPFPVVNARLRPIDVSEQCGAATCLSLEYSHERPRAAFLAQACADTGILNAPAFTEHERGELLWEKAYRDQLAGKEPDQLGYPLCAQCTAFAIMQFLGDDNERRASLVIAGAMAAGLDIILFDRNLGRNRTDPALVVGTFDTLASFRRRYWKQLEGKP
jgi:hypothetical protein